MASSSYARNNIANIQNANDPQSQQNMPPEDYLERQNVGTHLKEAISLLLENRPENPIQFLAEHFRNLQQTPANLGGLGANVPSANGVVASSVNILRAYRLITLNRVDIKSFQDNVFHAYTLLEKDHGSSGIKGFDFIKIAKMLCLEYPPEILKGILALLDKREEENVDFDEFLCGIRTIFMYSSFFEEMEQLFKHLDFQKTGKIQKDDLVQACGKLRSPDINHDLRIPDSLVIERIYQTMQVEEDGTINYNEFQTLVFKSTLEDSD